MMFGFSLPKSILTSRIDYERSKIFLLSVRVTFKKTTKYKLLYLKINSNKINSIYNQFYKSRAKYAIRRLQ